MSSPRTALVTTRDADEATPAPREVYDADARALVTVTPDDARRFAFLHRQVEAATLVQAVALKTIADERLYLAVGCASFKEYAETMLPGIGVNTARTYVQIGRRFADLLPGLESGDRQNVDSSQRLEADADAISGLGYKKLLGLVRADDLVLDEVVREQTLTTPDGQTYTLADLKAMKGREYNDLLNQVKAERRAMRARLSELEEGLKLSESERAADAERIEKANRDLARALDLERLYSGAKLTYEQQGAHLADADAAIMSARRHLMNCSVTEASAETHRSKLLELVRELSALAADARDAFGWVVSAAPDTTLADIDWDVDAALAEPETDTPAPARLTTSTGHA